MINRKQTPAIRQITHLSFKAPENQLLSNEIPVYLLDGGTEEIVRLELLFLKGSFHQHKPLVAFLAAHLLKTGTKGKTSDEISETLDFYGAYLKVEAQKDIVSISFLVLSKNLEHVLPLLQEIILAPVYPLEELEIMLKSKKDQHLINSRKVSYQARVHFSELIFGAEHPYGYRLKESDFEQIDRKDLTSYHQQWLQPENLSIIVSGRFPADIGEKLEAYFGGTSWAAIQKPGIEPIYDFPKQNSERLFIDKKDALQAAIRIGKRIIGRDHEDYHRLLITNTLLGGYFGSRLMKNIRQQKGYTYGVYSALVSMVKGNYFFISTQVGTDVLDLAKDQIYIELRRLHTVPASDMELRTLQNYLSGIILRSFDGPFAKADRFREMLIFGLEQDYFSHFLIELKNITPESLMETAYAYLPEESMAEVVVGKS